MYTNTVSQTRAIGIGSYFPPSDLNHPYIFLLHYQTKLLEPSTYPNRRSGIGCESGMGGGSSLYLIEGQGNLFPLSSFFPQSGLVARRFRKQVALDHFIHTWNLPEHWAFHVLVYSQHRRYHMQSNFHPFLPRLMSRKPDPSPSNHSVPCIQSTPCCIFSLIPPVGGLSPPVWLRLCRISIGALGLLVAWASRTDGRDISQSFNYLILPLLYRQ